MSPVTHTSAMVGRTSELAKLNNYFAQVKAGTRRVLFVSGEPGIGKTTLVRAFLDLISADSTVRVGRGQCVEQYVRASPTCRCSKRSRGLAASPMAIG